MEHLLPYERWIYTQPKGKRFRYITIFHELRDMYNELRREKTDKQKIKNELLMFCQNENIEYCDRIIDAFINELDNPGQDLNSGNLGVRGDVNDPTFVFFDF